MAIANADGSIVLTTKVDDSGVRQGVQSTKSQVMKLAAEYKKAGMNASDAMKKAWSEIDHTKMSTDKATKSTKEYGEQAQKSGGTAKSAFSSVGGALKKLAVAALAAFSVQKIIQFSKESSELATTTEASVQRLIDIYGEASQAVGDFIDANAQALGMSRASAASYASVYGNLFSVWADQRTNAELTNAYLNMTAVVASKTGRTVEDVQERIRSGLLGNTEAIEDLGVFVNVKTIEMTDAFQRMANGKSWEQLDAYTQQQIRSMAILEQATAKYGNEVAQTSALAKAQFQAAWQDFQATWGQVVNRVLIPVLTVLTEILVKSTAVMQSLFGISSETISQGNAIKDATENQKDLTKAVEETNEAMKKATASFDTVEILSAGIAQEASTNTIIPEISGGGLNEGLGIEETEKEMSTLERALHKIVTEIREAFEPLSKISFSNLGESLASLEEPLKKLVSVSWDILEGAIEKVIAPLAEFVIEDALPRFIDILGIAIDGLATVLDGVWDILEQFIDEFLAPIWEYAEPKILEVLDKMALKLEYFAKQLEETEVWEDLKTILSEIYDILEPIVKLIIDFLKPIIEFQMSSDFANLSFIFKSIEDAIGGLAALINGDFEDAGKHFKEFWIDNNIDRVKEEIDNLKPALDELKTKVGEFVEDWKTKIDDMVESWKAKISAWWTENVTPWFTKEKWEELFFKIGESLANAIAGVGGFIEKWKTNISNWWKNDVSPWFTAKKWKEVFDNIVTSISNFFTAEDGFVQTWKAKITDWWTENVAPWFTLEKWKELGSQMKDGIVDGFYGAINGIRGIINKILDGFQGLVNGAIDMLNSLIGGWNKVADVTPVLPSISSIKHIDLSKHKLPMLAQGTVVPPNREFLAVLGDNKKENEIVSPVSTMKQAFMEAMVEMGGNFGGRNTELILEVDGREFGRAVVELGNQENRRIGTRLVIA